MQESENRSGVKCVGKLASRPVVDGNRHKYNLLEAKFGNVKTAIIQAYPLCSTATEIVHTYKKDTRMLTSVLLITSKNQKQPR